MSERRAGRLIAADRTSVRYRAERPDDAPVRERPRALAAERRRFGYRRPRVLPRQAGLVMNRKRTERLYREKGLTARKRRGRERATGARAPILTVGPPPNARWSVDFVHDQLADGQQLRYSTGATRGLSSATMVTEFTSNAMLEWTQVTGIALALHRAPGKPRRSGVCEAFNGRMGDELLSATLFSASPMPGPPSPDGSPATTTGRIRRSGTLPRPLMPPNSPQWASGSP